MRRSSDLHPIWPIKSRRESTPRANRRHHLSADPRDHLNQAAFGALPRLDNAQRSLSLIEPQAPLAIGLVPAVTQRAMLREDRLDITLITDGGSSPRALTGNEDE